MSSPRLVGRDDELARLDALVDSLVDGAGGSCVIAGPSGIGKSALMVAVDDLAERSGAHVLRASGSELEGALSFGAVRDLLGPAVVRLPRDEQDELLSGPACFARPVLGLGRSETEGDPLYGLFWLTVALAERQPLLLAVDDLHWLDHESARFCTYLARRIEGLPVLLVATAQTHQSGPTAEYVDHLVDVARVIEPMPLPPAAIGKLVPAHPASEVHRLTGGNPMLIAELVRALDADPHASLESVTLPGVGAAILRRVNRLSPEAVALARAVALSPTPLAPGDAAALAELDESVAAAAADMLVHADVFEWDGKRLGFLHPLMRTAVYEDLEPVSRRTAHDRAATVLHERGASAETIAAHVLAAEPRGSTSNVEILVAAADEAETRRAPRAAATYLQRAVVELHDGSERLVGLRRRLGLVLLGLGRSDAVEVLTAALADAGTENAALAVDLARAHLAADQSEQAAALLAPLLVPAPSSETDLDVAAHWLLAAVDAGIDREGEAGIPEDLPGTTPVERRALLALGMSRFQAGASAGRLRPILKKCLGDLGPLSMFGLCRDLLLGTAGLLAEREQMAHAEIERARRTGETGRYAAAQLSLAIIDNQRGRLREAEASLRLGLEAPEVDGWWHFGLQSWLTTTLSMRGRFSEAEELLASATGPGTGTGTEDATPSVEQWTDGRRAELAMDRGDYAAAIAPAERALAAPRGGPRFSATGCDLAVALAAVGETDRALPLAREMVRAADLLGDQQAIGWAYAALGRVLGGDDGIALLRRSIEVLEATPFRWNQAHAELALGMALRAAGKRTEAREVLGSALEYAVANDAAPIERAAREELRLCGARPRRAARTGAAALTPSEERIARLAAEGRTNKEIAQHLFVTVKNVEMHLVHAYRKLGVSSRRELGAVLSAAAASPE